MYDLGLPIIALITDFGPYGQHYVASMKGTILKINPSANIVDVSHNITPFSITEANFVLYSSYKYFPEGTIFVAVIDPGVGSSRKIIAMQTKSNYYFVGPDNGLFSSIFDVEEISEIVQLTNNEYFMPSISETFHGRDIMAPVAAHLSKETALKNFGPQLSLEYVIKINELTPKMKGENRIQSKIQYIDSFGNCITTIKLDNYDKSKLLKHQFSRENSYIITVSEKQHKGSFFSHYAEQTNKEKEKGVIILKKDSFNFLELSLNKENLASKLNISVGDIFYLEIE